MRGKIAKELRVMATGLLPDGTIQIDRPLYRKMKKMYKTDKPRKEPKFPKARRSKWKNAKLPQYGKQFPKKERALDPIGKVYGDLTEKGRKMALNLSKLAGRIPQNELRRRVATLLANKELYVIQPEEQSERK